MHNLLKFTFYGMRLCEILFLYSYLTKGPKLYVTKFRVRSVFSEGSKRLLKGAEESPARGRSVFFTSGQNVLTRDRSVFFLRAEVSNRGRSVRSRSVRGRSVHNSYFLKSVVCWGYICNFIYPDYRTNHFRSDLHVFWIESIYSHLKWWNIIPIPLLSLL